MLHIQNVFLNNALLIKDTNKEHILMISSSYESEYE